GVDSGENPYPQHDVPADGHVLGVAARHIRMSGVEPSRQQGGGTGKTLQAIHGVSIMAPRSSVLDARIPALRVAGEPLIEIRVQSRKPRFDRLIAENELANTGLLETPRRRLTVLIPSPGNPVVQPERPQQHRNGSHE